MLLTKAQRWTVLQKACEFAQPPVVLEVGVLRDLDAAESDGHSTLLFWDWLIAHPECSYVGIDHAPDAVILTEGLKHMRYGPQKDRIHVICGDGRETIEKLVHSGGLNFLGVVYLDMNNDPEKTLEAFLVLEPALEPRAVVVVDDARELGIPGVGPRGKADKLWRVLQARGWVVEFPGDCMMLATRG